MDDIEEKQELIKLLHKSYWILKIHGMISGAESVKIKQRIIKKVCEIENEMEKKITQETVR